MLWRIAIILLGVAFMFGRGFEWFVHASCARAWQVIHNACGGPALRVHRAEAMVDG